MLVLARQRDETIVIGDDIEITIVDIRYDRVRVGITAPRAVQVHRKEVYQAIQHKNDQASSIQVTRPDAAGPNVRHRPKLARR